MYISSDAAMRRIIEFDFNREHGAADEILGCDGRGGFTRGAVTMTNIIQTDPQYWTRRRMYAEIIFLGDDSVGPVARTPRTGF